MRVAYGRVPSPTTIGLANDVYKVFRDRRNSMLTYQSVAADMGMTGRNEGLEVGPARTMSTTNHAQAPTNMQAAKTSCFANRFMGCSLSEGAPESTPPKILPPESDLVQPSIDIIGDTRRPGWAGAGQGEFEGAASARSVGNRCQGVFNVCDCRGHPRVG